MLAASLAFQKSVACALETGAEVMYLSVTLVLFPKVSLAERWPGYRLSAVVPYRRRGPRPCLARAAAHQRWPSSRDRARTLRRRPAAMPKSPKRVLDNVPRGRRGLHLTPHRQQEASGNRWLAWQRCQGPPSDLPIRHAGLVSALFKVLQCVHTSALGGLADAE